MKDPDEKYWLLIVFTSPTTRQHLSATAFPPFSNIDFLCAIECLSAPLQKPNKSEETLLSFPQIKRQTKFIRSHGTFFVCLRASSLHSCSLILYCLFFLDWNESGGLWRWLIEMYALGQDFGFTGKTVWLLPPRASNTKSRLPQG